MQGLGMILAGCVFPVVVWLGVQGKMKWADQFFGALPQPLKGILQIVGVVLAMIGIYSPVLIFYGVGRLLTGKVEDSPKDPKR